MRGAGVLTATGTSLANAVDFFPNFRGVREAYVAGEFQGAAAAVVLRPDPAGAQFTSSPYWGEALQHLAGFMVNGNPAKPASSTFVVMGYGSDENLAPLEPGRQYLTYTRVSRWERDTAFCAAYVFDPVTSRIDLRYQELETATWRRILDSTHASGPQYCSAAPRTKEHKVAAEEVKNYREDLSPTLVAAAVETQAEKTSGGAEFQIIMDSLATATGSAPSESTDDTVLAHIGVDSIMAIEVVSAVMELGVDLPAALLFDLPTIGDLRREFCGQYTTTPANILAEGPSSDGEDENAVSAAQDADDDFTPAISVSESLTGSSSSLVHVEKQPESPAPETAGSNEGKDTLPQLSVEENGTSPQPSVRITLLQGRPNKAKTTLYMMADGTGRMASFIYLRPFKSKQAVYGVDSPFFKCPTRMTSDVGIEGVAKLTKILVLGATGRTGIQVVLEAVQRGHSVTALVRNPSALDELTAELTDTQKSNPALVKGPPLNRADVTNTITTAAPTPPPASSWMANILAALAETTAGWAERAKFVYVSSIGVGKSSPNVHWVLRALVGHSSVELTYDDHDAVEAGLGAAGEGVGWVILRPGRFTEGDDKKQAKVWPAEKGMVGMTARISRGAVARFSLDAAEGSGWDGKDPIIPPFCAA